MNVPKTYLSPLIEYCKNAAVYNGMEQITPYEEILQVT